MLKIVILLFTLLIGAGAYAQSTKDIVGKWTNEDQTRILEFVKNGETYEVIVRKSPKNEFFGKKQITGLVPDGTQAFKNGTLQIFKKNKKMDCTVKFLEADVIEIAASLGFFNKTGKWTKVE